jgi:hypothetical protein
MPAILSEQWLLEALKLIPGEEIKLECENREDCWGTKQSLLGVQTRLGKVNPEVFKIVISQAFVDKKYLVILRKRQTNPLIGFKTTLKGEVEKITISFEDKQRRIKLMLQDGMTPEQIMELEENLTEEDKTLLGINIPST